MCITSVERIQEYIQLAPQRDTGDPNWREPQSGADSKRDGDEDAEEGQAGSSSRQTGSRALAKARKIDEMSAPGSIAFTTVTARYAPHLPPALHDFTLRVRPGQRVGICGRSGSGKSTLLAVLWRLIEYEEESGEVCVGGIEIGSKTLREYRDGMSIIPQGESTRDAALGRLRESNR